MMFYYDVLYTVYNQQKKPNPIHPLYTFFYPTSRNSMYQSIIIMMYDDGGFQTPYLKITTKKKLFTFFSPLFVIKPPTYHSKQLQTASFYSTNFFFIFFSLLYVTVTFPFHPSTPQLYLTYKYVRVFSSILCVE